MLMPETTRDKRIDGYLKKLRMKKIALFLNLITISWTLLSQTISLSLPDSSQLRWQKYEQTMFVHFGPATWQHREYDNLSIPPRRINPEQLNTDQWCEVAVSWGAKMIVFVAKHTGGFCWWQTNTTNYGIKESPWRDGRGDVLKDLSESCKKYGLGLGIYIYPGDDTWGAGIGSGGITKDPSQQESYNKVFRQQLTEVLSKYGPVREVWFDGSCKIEIGDILEKYASDAVIFQGPHATIRWVGNEDGYAPFSNWYTLRKEDLLSGVATAVQSDPFGDIWAPVEIDVPFLKNKGHKWFWAPGTDSLILTTDQFMDLYYKSVGRGAVLLLNSTPDTTGLIPPSHVAAYKAFGDEIKRRFGIPVAVDSGEGKSLEMKLPGAVKVNHVILQEDVAKGQRVLEFEITAQDAEGNWLSVYQGTSVGQKKICYFDAVTSKAIKVTFQNYKDVPQILSFSAYHADGVAMAPEVRNDKNKFYDARTGSRGEEEESIYTEVATWQSNKRLTDIDVTLTKYMTSIGQYELVFESFSGEPEFRDWEMELYGSKRADNVEYLGEGKFRITRSQQTLDEFPAIFRVKLRSERARVSGAIKIRKLVY